ncbi:MAG: hypothetical protein HQ539_00845 [Parcubacteria group bacterium]|nr:hypothetical protein [Parcubacteria group bacterium]
MTPPQSGGVKSLRNLLKTRIATRSLRFSTAEMSKVFTLPFAQETTVSFCVLSTLPDWSM